MLLSASGRALLSVSATADKREMLTLIKAREKTLNGKFSGFVGLEVAI